MRRRTNRGEGLLSGIIVLALVILVVISAAIPLGKNIIGLFVGSGDANKIIEGRVDEIEFADPTELEFDTDDYPMLPK